MANGGNGVDYTDGKTVWQEIWGIKVSEETFGAIHHQTVSFAISQLQAYILM